jgi:hypothetical protein
MKWEDCPWLFDYTKHIDPRGYYQCELNNNKDCLKDQCPIVMLFEGLSELNTVYGKDWNNLTERGKKLEDKDG